ncbi:ATP-dependent DNA helicase sgs1, partial [Actinomortierella ambigua]
MWAVAQCVADGLDCLLMSSSGWARTVVFFLPLLLWKDRIMLILTPLEALMEQHQRGPVSFNAEHIAEFWKYVFGHSPKPQQLTTLDNLGVPNVVFNQESPLLHESLQALENGHIRAIIATPEFVFLNKKFKTLWDSTSWHSRLMAVVIDEAHCVINWGDSFRPFYSRVGELRTLASAPLISVSATLSPRDVRELTDKLHLDGDASMVVNVGNNRPNVYLEVRKLPHASVEGLQFLLDFAKTIIYVDQRMMT